MKYVEIPMSQFKYEERKIVEAVINEGRMRVKEEILEKIERKITEAYAEDNRDLVNFLEELIRDLELDF